VFIGPRPPAPLSTNTTTNTTAHHVGQHHPPMPPTKAMGAITQNRHGFPTATPLSTLWYSGVVRFGRARERRHRLLGCIFWAKFCWRGGLIPWPNCDGRTELDHLSRSKKSTIPQSTVGNLVMFGEWVVGWNGGPVCGDGNWGNIQRLGGWKAWAIGDRAVHFNESAYSHAMITPQSTSVRLGGG
jgi:hypothetical protein